MTNPNPIIGRRLFVDGIVRPVFANDADSQYVIDLDEQTRVYGVWILDEADKPLTVSS